MEHKYHGKSYSNNGEPKIEGYNTISGKSAKYKSLVRHEAKEAKKLAHPAKSKALEGAKKGTKGIHQMGLKDEPRHKRLDGTEVKY